MHPHKFQENSEVVNNANYKADYFRITFLCPRISRALKPGQFIHLRLPDSPDLLLRRPFSVFDTAPCEGTVSVIYKIVGLGTRRLSMLACGHSVDLLGPLGISFPVVGEDQHAVIVAGGYGCASTYLVAKHAASPGICLLGARGKDDILVVDEFRQTGFDVRISTDDGSLGHKGRVTALLEAVLRNGITNPLICACGPNAMLEAVGHLSAEYGYDSYLSYDLPMCCGVGACFTCVMKMKTGEDDGWEYLRTCKFGPVLRASNIYWE